MIMCASVLAHRLDAKEQLTNIKYHLHSYSAIKNWPPGPRR